MILLCFGFLNLLSRRVRIPVLLFAITTNHPSGLGFSSIVIDIGVPNFGTSDCLPVKTVTICVSVHAPGPKKSANDPPARMRALEGGRDVLSWVCVRGIRPHVWCALDGTIPVARRLRVGRAVGRCLAAMAQTRSLLSRNRDRCCVICAPRLYRNWDSFVWAKPDPYNSGVLLLLLVVPEVDL